MDVILLREITLGKKHFPTANTQHTVAGKPMRPAAQLHIVRHEGDPGYYLLYLDANGMEQTDTWHMSLDDALRQAEFEFHVVPAEWTVVDADV